MCVMCLLGDMSSRDMMRFWADITGLQAGVTVRVVLTPLRVTGAVAVLLAAGVAAGVLAVLQQQVGRGHRHVLVLGAHLRVGPGADRVAVAGVRPVGGVAAAGVAASVVVVV